MAPVSKTYRSPVFFARFSSVLTAFLASSLPAPGGGTEEHGGTGARRNDHRRPKGPSPGGEGFCLSRTGRVDRRGAGRDDDQAVRQSRGQEGIGDEDEGAGGGPPHA